MCSPLAGCWKLYGRENHEVLAEALHLPNQFKQAMKNVRICEEIHVCEEGYHINVMVPAYTIPAHSKEMNFTFGVEHTQSLPFGRCGKGAVQKESDTKWVFNFAHENGTGSITRELRNDEMWVHVDACGVKAIRKFERCTTSGNCPSAKAGASPFQGCWKLYGSDNFDKFMEVNCVPLHWRCIFANMTVMESIHVNGNDVHVKICLPDVSVPHHVHEYHGKFNEAHDVSLPFGHHGSATVQKVSDCKWQGKVTGLKAFGDVAVTREVRCGGKEMWVTMEVKGKHVISKFMHCGPCGSQDACTKTGSCGSQDACTKTSEGCQQSCGGNKC